MTDVNANDLRQINDASDIYDLYVGQGSQAKSGIEIEIPFYNPKAPSLAVMTKGQNRVVKNSAMAAIPEDDWLHYEVTSEVLEVAGNAYDFAHMKEAFKDINTKIHTLMDKADEYGLKRSYFQELPEHNMDDLITRLLGFDRYKALFSPYREDMKKLVRHFMINRSTQVSISHRDPEHLLKNIRRIYMLAPFLFLATDNGSGFLDGRPFSGHLGMYLRYHGFPEGRGGVLPYVFKVKSGEELITQHINLVMNNPLPIYYNAEGNLVQVPSGDWSVTFNSLRKQGLNTSSNYYLSESLVWPEVKIAALRDSEGEVFGHRYEARMFGAGIHQHQSAYMIVNALAFHEKFGNAVDELLKRYGFDDDHLEMTALRLEQAYSVARNHGERFFDIPYGTGTMAAFAKEFADLFEDMADDIGMSDEAHPLLTICRTGYTDTKVNRTLFPSIGSALVQQRYYDASIFKDPNRCAHDVFRREVSLARRASSSSSSVA